MIESAMLHEDELKTPLAALRTRLLRQPNKLAMVQPQGRGRRREYTWREVGEQAAKMASHLVALNLPPRTPIALISENCAEWIIADLAIWMAGHVSVPLYATMTADSVRKITEHAETRHAFIGKLNDWREIRRGLAEETYCIAFELAPEAAHAEADARWEEIMARQPPLEKWAQRDNDEVATIIYTSGTSGTPKGVMHGFGALKAVGNRIAFAYEMSGDDRMVSYLPLAHVAERTAIELGFLYVGVTVHFVESLATFGADVKQARPTLFFAVPRIWSQFRQKAGEQVPLEKLDRLLSRPIMGLFARRKILAAMGLDHCRIALSGAAALSPQLSNWFHALGLEILEGYGMTENLAWSHTTPEGHQRIGWVGKPNDSVECRLGENGEILVKSPGAMLGYYKNPQLTGDAFTDGGWLRTGDTGEMDEDGYLRITGRTDEPYKTAKGMYVCPAPIEAKLVAASGIVQACVMGEGLPQSVALVDLSAEERTALAGDENATRQRLTSELATLLQQVNAQLNPHEQMDALVVTKAPWTIDNNALTPTFKVQRHALEQTHAPRLADWGNQGGIIWE